MHIDFLLKVFADSFVNDAIIWKDTVYKYECLKKHIDEFRQVISVNRIQEGAVVALNGDFSPVSIALLLALIERGCIIIPISNKSEKIENKLLSIAQAEFIFRVDDNDVITSEFLSHKSDNSFYSVLRERRHPGLVLFTSGTSGEPKAAVHDFNALLEKFQTRRKALRTLNFLLFDHWGGLNTLFHILSNGGVVITTSSRNPQNVCKLIEKQKIELLPASPTFLNLLLVSGSYDAFDLSSLKIISYGTEPMPIATLKRLKSIFPDVKLLQTYGLIELGVLRSKSKDDNSLWVNVGGEGFQTRVTDGLLEIKAKSAMLGYLNASSPFTKDGWFKTGDAVEIDGEYH
jgi:long-chain acyl-CoA synthetase